MKWFIIYQIRLKLHENKIKYFIHDHEISLLTIVSYILTMTIYVSVNFDISIEFFCQLTRTQECFQKYEYYSNMKISCAEDTYRF